MTFIGSLNEKYYYIYPPHAADFHNETQRQWLIVDIRWRTCKWSLNRSTETLKSWWLMKLHVSECLIIMCFNSVLTQNASLFLPHHIPSLSASLFLCRLTLPHLSHLLPHFFSHFITVPLLNRTFGWVQRVMRGNVTFHCKQRTVTLECQWDDWGWGVGMERMEGWMGGGVEDDRTTLFHCVFFKDMAFFFLWLF